MLFAIFASFAISPPFRRYFRCRHFFHFLSDIYSSFSFLHYFITDYWLFSSLFRLSYYHIANIAFFVILLRRFLLLSFSFISSFLLHFLRLTLLVIIDIIISHWLRFFHWILAITSYWFIFIFISLLIDDIIFFIIDISWYIRLPLATD